MEDPLTEEEKSKWLDLVKTEFLKKYQEALTCGALSEEDVEPHNYTLAKCVLQITAEAFEPLSDDGKKMLSNLEKFI